MNKPGEFALKESNQKKGITYNINKANDETIRVCLENESKTPIPVPDDHATHLKKIFGVSFQSLILGISVAGSIAASHR